MKKLLVYLRDYRKEVILGPFFKLLEAAFELLVPLIIAAIIDRGIANSDQPYIVRMCLLLVLLGVIGLGCSITAQYYAAKAAAGFIKKLKRALFIHIQGLSFTELDQLGVSTMITRMTSDMNQIQVGVNLTLRLLLRSPLVVFGAMLMAFTIDARAAIVFVVAVPILAIVVFGIMLWCIPLYKKVQVRLDGVLGLTRENLSGTRVVRAFCKEPEELHEFVTRNETLTQIQKHVGRISALMNPITFIIINISIVGLIWIGAIRVDLGIMQQGAVVALYNYMSQILVELVKLANFIITVTKTIACGNRVQDMFEIAPSLDGPDAPAELAPSHASAVVFSHASLRYKDAADTALTDISFTAARGQTIGIIGGTGSGKSSLVHMILRFYDASSGEVLVNGINVKDYTITGLREKIGLIPQKAVLFQGSIRENICWGKPDATDEEIIKAITTAQALDVVNAKGGLDFMIEAGGKNLSGGQRQRLTIARALVRNPEILILDDSASALDFATDAALRKAIREMPSGPTVFIISQRASSVQFADQIIVLDDGKIADIGTNDALLDSCDIYREIYESQFRKEDALNAKS